MSDMGTTTKTKTFKSGHRMKTTTEDMGNGMTFVEVFMQGPTQTDWVKMTDRFDFEA